MGLGLLGGLVGYNGIMGLGVVKEGLLKVILETIIVLFV